jgi:MFS family permease
VLAVAAGVFAATFAGFLAVGAVLPVLPRYVRGPLGAGNVAVGVVIGAFAFTAVFGRPLAGRLADVRGRRQVLVAGLLTMSIAGALLFLPAGIPELVLARLAVGAGEGFLFTAAATWIVDLAPVPRRGQAIGLFGLSVWSGLTLGPLAGEALYALGGYDAVWTLATVAPLAGALLALRLRETRLPPAARQQRSSLLPRAAVGPGAALALANVGYATLAAFVVLHLSHRHVGHGAGVFTAYAASVVGTRLLAGRLPDLIGARRSAIAAGLAEAAGLGLIAAATTWWTAIAGAVVMGAGFSLLYPSLALAVIARVDPARRGAAMGSFTAFFDVGVGLGAPIAGAIASLGGYEAAFWGAAGIAVLASLTAALTARAPVAAGAR